MSTTYTKREKFRYLLGLSGQNIIYGTVTSVLAYYLQFTILIPAVWVGLILSVARIFDAVKDPFIGAMISRGKHKLKDYLIAVPIPTAILTILCFSNGIYSAENSMPKNILIVLSAFVFYIIWEVVFTIGDIPITGYPSVLTSDEGDRTKLLSLRPIGGMASGISTLAVQPIAFALSAVFGGSARDERNAFLITVAAFSIIGGALFQFTAIGSVERVSAERSENSGQLRYFITNPLLRTIGALGLGVLSVIKDLGLKEPYVGQTELKTGEIGDDLTYYFASKNPQMSLIYTVLFGAGSIVGLIVSAAAVPSLSKKYGTKRLFVTVNLINIFPNLLLFALYIKYPQNMTDIPQTVAMFVLTLITGSCVSISSTVQMLIISQAVDLEEKISGNRPDALFFSAQTFIVKIGTGLSSLAASIGYAAVNFSSAQTAALNKFIASGGIPRLDGRYSNLMTLLFMLYTLPVALSSLLSALPFIRRERE